MAKNIIITPAPGGNPNIDFQGATSGTIKLEVRDDGSLLISGGTETNILSLYDETANPVRVPSISLEDSNATHHLKIIAGSNLSANRTFTLSTGDAARALDISAADVTISSFGATIVDDADASAARTTLGVAIGSDVQAYAANLTTYAGITPSANVQTILGAADYSAIRTSLGLVIGTNVQAYDADLTTWAGLTPSAFFQTLVDDTDASTARTTLGVAIGSNVQAYSANLTTYAGIAPSANVQTILGAADYAAVRTALGLVIGTNVQAYDADLTTWAGLTPSAFFQTLVDDTDASTARTTLGLAIGTNVQAYSANLTTYAGIAPSANVQSLLGAADYSAMRTLLGLVIGTNVQAYDADLTTWAGLTPSAFFQTLVDDTDASTARSTLGLGTSATVATGTSGATIPLLNTAVTFSDTLTVNKASGGTSQITVGGSNAQDSVLVINANSGQSRYMDFRTAGTVRWRIIGANNTAESGSNVGSDFVLNSFNDAGTLIGSAFTITRSTRVTNFTVAPTFTDASTTRTNLGLGTVATLASGVVGAGKQGIWVPASAMWPRPNTPCADIEIFETATNRVAIPYLAFDTGTPEFAQFNLQANKQFGTTTVTFVPVWMHPSTTTNFGVVWELSALGRSNDDAAENAFGTAGSSTDTGGTTNDIYMGPESSAITIGGTFAAEDFVTFQISRATANGSDTMAVDAQLIGVMLYVTTTANTDT